MMDTRKVLAGMLGTTAIIIGGAVVVGPANVVHGYAEPVPSTDVMGLTLEQRATAGDDNRDGEITEGESGWACHLMGNKVCGPRP